VCRRDVKNLVLVLLQAPLIALLLACVFRPGTDFFPLSFYFAVTISVIWIGGVNSVREVAREWPLVFREYRAGLSPGAYLAAKVIVFSVLSIVQALLFGGFLAAFFRHFRADAVVLLLLAAGSVGGALVGLCVSSLSAGVNRAISLLPVVLIPQIFFAGALVPFDRMPRVGRLFSRLTVSRPIFSLLKRTQLLELSVWHAEEWIALSLLFAVLTILAASGLVWRVRSTSRAR
jgi:hypothetical protein